MLQAFNDSEILTYFSLEPNDRPAKGIEMAYMRQEGGTNNVPFLSIDKEYVQERLHSFFEVTKERYSRLSCLEMAIADNYLFRDGNFMRIRDLAKRVGMKKDADLWQKDLFAMKEEATAEFKRFASHGYRTEPNFLDTLRGYRGVGEFKYPLPSLDDINLLMSMEGRRAFNREVRKMGNDYFFSAAEALSSCTERKEGDLRDTEFFYKPGPSERNFLQKFLGVDVPNEFRREFNVKPRGYSIYNCMDKNRELYNDRLFAAKTYKPSPVDTSLIGMSHLESKFAEVLAEAIHADWYHNRFEEAKQFSNVVEKAKQMVYDTDGKYEYEVALDDAALAECKKNYPDFVPWKDLPEEKRQASISQAKETVKVLKANGYDIDACLSGKFEPKDNPFLPGRDHSRIIDIIAENAHDVWARDKIVAGWTYDDVRDNVKMHHPMLMPYRDIPEKEKEYDKAIANVFCETIERVQSLGLDDSLEDSLEKKAEIVVNDAVKEKNALEPEKRHPSLDPRGTVYTVFPEDIEKGIVPPGCDIGVDTKGNRFLKTFNESRTVPEDGLVLVKKYDASNIYTVCTKKQFDVLYKVGEDGLAKKAVRQEQNLKPGLRTKKGTKLS